MSYIDRNLLEGEHITYRAGVHWIIFVGPAAMFLIAVAASIGLSVMNLQFSGQLAPAGAILKGIGVLLVLIAAVPVIGAWMRFAGSEFVVTNRRVLVKAGLLSRHSIELMLPKIESIGVDQGLWARLLGYGTIVVTGTGGTHEAFHTVDSPLEFRRQVEAAVPA